MKINTCEITFRKSTVSFSPNHFYTLPVTKVFLKCFLQKLALAIVWSIHFLFTLLSVPKVRVL